MVDRVVHGPPVGGQVGVARDLGPRRHLALDPALERLRRRHLARDLEPVHDRLLVVALGVGEVLEVQRRLHLGVLRQQPHASHRPRPRDVRRHADHVVGHRVAQPLRVEGERQLVGVVHQVGAVVVAEAVDEQRAVRVHHALRRQRPGQLPDDDRLGVVDQVLADAGQVVLHLDVERAQVVGRADARQQQQARGVDRAAADDYFPGGNGVSRIGGDRDGTAAAQVDPPYPGVGADRQVRPLAHDRVQVGDA